MKDYKNQTIIGLIICLVITIWGWLYSQGWAEKFGNELIMTDIEVLKCQTELKSVYQLKLLRGTE